MLLGTVLYDASELLAILQEPARGNGLIFLAHQLIATKLNLGAGADPSVIQAAIDQADNLIGALVVPPVGTARIHPRDASSLTETLDAFNNGKLGVNCDALAVEASDWSGVKGLYR